MAFKGTFGLVLSKRLVCDKSLDKDIKATIRKWENRKKELIKTGMFTPERKAFFNEQVGSMRKLVRKERRCR